MSVVSTIEVPVAWGDMDALGHVNNAIYFRWFESGRIDYFGQVGISASLAGAACGPILANASCNFKAPLTFPDTVEVVTQVTRVGRSSFAMSYSIRSMTRNVTAAEGEGIVVWYDYKTERSAPLPDDLRDRMS